MQAIYYLCRHWPLNLCLTKLTFTILREILAIPIWVCFWKSLCRVNQDLQWGRTIATPGVPKLLPILNCYIVLEKSIMALSQESVYKQKQPSLPLLMKNKETKKSLLCWQMLDISRCLCPRSFDGNNLFSIFSISSNNSWFEVETATVRLSPYACLSR